MTPGFIITSALNTRFGIFSAEQRLKQTIATIDSIKHHCPDAPIALLEMAGEPLKLEQQAQLDPLVASIIDFTPLPAVQEIYKNPNWDVVKSSTELMCFEITLEVLRSDESFKLVDRLFKVSGRYLLNEDFNIDGHSFADKIVFAKRRKSQFLPAITGGVAEQFMSRCWSFPAADSVAMQRQFKAMRLAMATIVANGGYLDIEHLLFLYTDPNKIIELDKIGVQGCIGPNGQAVRD